MTSRYRWISSESTSLYASEKPLKDTQQWLLKETKQTQEIQTFCNIQLQRVGQRQTQLLIIFIYKNFTCNAIFLPEGRYPAIQF